MVATAPVRTSADTDGDEWAAGAGWDVAFGASTLTPYLRLDYTRTKVEGYRESGSTGYEMTYDTNRGYSTVGVAGLRYAYAASESWGVWVPQLRFEYDRELRHESRSTDSAFVLDSAGNVLDLDGDDPDRSYFRLGASVLVVVPGGWMPFVDVETLIGYQDFERHTVTLGLRREF
jgi:outer membrane autotransporter protein